jgi:hypothetical protein
MQSRTCVRLLPLSVFFPLGCLCFTDASSDSAGLDSQFKEPYMIFSEPSSRLDDLHVLIADRKGCNIRRLTTARGDGPPSTQADPPSEGTHQHIQPDGQIIKHAHAGGEEAHHHAPDGTMVIGSDKPPEVMMHSTTPLPSQRIFDLFHVA